MSHWGRRAIGQPYEAVVIGGSAGASEPLRQILGTLGPGFPLPVILVQHLHPEDKGLMAENLAYALRLPVIEVLDKMPVRPGRVYVAPADYHVLVERGRTFALSVEEPVRWSRPSIDVLFESAASVWGSALMAILLSGANEDGAAGLRTVKMRGGKAVAQDPDTAIFRTMPAAGLVEVGIEAALSPQQIGELLQHMDRGKAHG